jgi:hypothetical protein
LCGFEEKSSRARKVHVWKEIQRFQNTLSTSHQFTALHKKSENYFIDDEQSHISYCRITNNKHTIIQVTTQQHTRRSTVQVHDIIDTGI